MSVTNFAGQTAYVIHRDDPHRTALEGQLRRVGLVVRSLSPNATLNEVTEADIVLFDADVGHDSLFPWGTAPPPMPMVAIIGSEAPGRVEWALSQGASAFLVKPIGSHGAYQALIVACHLHIQTRGLRHSVAELSGRVRARSLVVRAAVQVMNQHDLEARQALTLMRRAAMAARITVEELATMLVERPSLGFRLPKAGGDIGLVGRDSDDCKYQQRDRKT